tara:strand:- start:14990 stop:15505 length:516 start_codon:yes stop_codon:yes gene_type:complete
MIKEYNNCIPEWLHNRTKAQLEDPSVSWYFPSTNDSNLSNAAFCKNHYNHPANYENWAEADSLIYVLDYWIHANKDWFEFERVQRCMTNFYARGQCTSMHTDIPDDGYYSLLYYVNDSDGGTQINGTKFNHTENKMLFFKSTLLHGAIPTVTSPRRLTVNWVLKGKIKKPA